MGARHPLPYAFAKAHNLLLEQDGERATLWASLTPRDLHGDHFGLYKPGTLAHAHARPAA